MRGIICRSIMWAFTAAACWSGSSALATDVDPMDMPSPITAIEEMGGQEGLRDFQPGRLGGIQPREDRGELPDPAPCLRVSAVRPIWGLGERDLSAVGLGGGRDHFPKERAHGLGDSFGG